MADAGSISGALAEVGSWLGMHHFKPKKSMRLVFAGQLPVPLADATPAKVIKATVKIIFRTTVSPSGWKRNESVKILSTPSPNGNT